jgi:hypothetical protein
MSMQPLFIAQGMAREDRIEDSEQEMMNDE